MNTLSRSLQHRSPSRFNLLPVVDDGASYNAMSASHLPLRRFLLTWIDPERMNDALSARHVVSVTPADAVLDFCRNFDCGTAELPLQSHATECDGPNLVRVWTGSVGSSRVVVREVIDKGAKHCQHSGTAA